MTGGTLSNFSGSGSTYSATFTPTDNSTSDGIIHVANNAFTCSANNNNQDEKDTNNTVTLTINNITILPEPSPEPSPELSPELSPDPWPEPETSTPFSKDPITNFPKSRITYPEPLESELAPYQGLDIDFDWFVTYGDVAKPQESKEEDEKSGLKIIKLNEATDVSRSNNLTPREEQQTVGVVLTKQPSDTVEVRVSISNSRNLKIINPKLTFTPGNWQVPQEIKIEGCTNENLEVTFTAKAGNQGGFKGTERDKLTIPILRTKPCDLQAKTSPNTSSKPHMHYLDTSAIASYYPELNSPLYMLLRALLTPVFFVAGITSSFQRAVTSTINNKQTKTTSKSHTSIENNISSDHFTAKAIIGEFSSPGSQVGLPIGNELNESTLISTNPSSLTAPRPGHKSFLGEDRPHRNGAVPIMKQ